MRSLAHHALPPFLLRSQAGRQGGRTGEREREQDREERDLQTSQTEKARERERGIKQKPVLSLSLLDSAPAAGVRVCGVSE